MTKEKLAKAVRNYSEYKSLAEDTLFKAQEIWVKMDVERVKKLKETLANKELSMCSADSHHSVGENEEEKLGLFPSEKMRLVYYVGEEQRGSHYSEHLHRFVSLTLHCSHHFPKEINLTWPSEASPGDQNMLSEVEERNGDLFTIVNSIKIDVPVRELDWKEEVFDHFGLPPLPEYPQS